MEGFKFNRGPQKSEREDLPLPNITDIDGALAKINQEDNLNITDPGAADRESLMDSTVKSEDMQIVAGAEAGKNRVPGKEYDANEDLAKKAKGDSAGPTLH